MDVYVAKDLRETFYLKSFDDHIFNRMKESVRKLMECISKKTRPVPCDFKRMNTIIFFMQDSETKEIIMMIIDAGSVVHTALLTSAFTRLEISENNSDKTGRRLIMANITKIVKILSLVTWYVFFF